MVLDQVAVRRRGGAAAGGAALGAAIQPRLMDEVRASAPCRGCRSALRLPIAANELTQALRGAALGVLRNAAVPLGPDVHRGPAHRLFVLRLEAWFPRATDAAAGRTATVENDGSCLWTTRRHCGYLAINPRVYVDGSLRLVPTSRRDRVSDVFRTLSSTLRWWMLGRIGLMALNAVVITAGLWLLGVPLALTLGLLSGLLNFIPNVGPILAAAPAILIALTQGPTQALYVALLYLVYQSLTAIC